MIREFKPSDMERVIDIWLEASIKAHDFVDSEFWKSKVKDMRDLYIPSSETYVYEEEGLITGFISLSNDTIAAIFVLPDFQGGGIGKKLVNKAKEKRKTVDLTVYKQNLKSIEFYKHCGFSIEQEQVDEHTGHPELVMVYHS